MNFTGFPVPHQLSLDPMGEPLRLMLKTMYRTSTLLRFLALLR